MFTLTIERMFSPEWFQGKKITVMGLGVHGGGLGAAKWLAGRGARVTVTDLRDKKALADSITVLDKAVADMAKKSKKGSVRKIRYVLGSHPEELFSGADMVIRNPAVPRGNRFIALAQKSGVPVESDISIFFILCPFPIMAVTGTKGKTTTTMLLAEICRASDPRTVIGGNVRISVLDSLDKLIALSTRNAKAKKNSPNPPIVLELSSWQLESLEPCGMSPRVGVVLNVMEDHLDRYDGIADYARAKEICVAFQNEGDVAVLNADDPWTMEMADRKGGLCSGPHKGRRILFSAKRRPKGNACFLRDGQIVLHDRGTENVIGPIAKVKLLGAHNVSNILAAVAAACEYGIPLPAVRKGLASFKGVPYRLETIRLLSGIRYVNDTAATATDASIAALETFGATTKKRIILITGGADKNLSFGAWAKSCAKHAKALVIFDGTATPKMTAALDGARATATRTLVRSMPDAVAEARRQAKRGDVILLSPGCASFGVFKNEFDRGDQFTSAVKKLRT